MRFLQISALKKLPIGSQGKKLQLYAEGGVFAGYAVKARQNTRTVLKNDDLKKWTRTLSKHEFGDEPGQFNMSRFDAGLVVGAGVSYRVGPGRISLDARFSAGAIDLGKAEPVDTDLKYPSVHTRDFALLLGYSVPMKAK